MPDDVKIQLGIDVEALKRSATEATNVLTRAFEQQNLGANLLGSGIAATNLGQQQQGGKDTIRGVIDALNSIERTLTIGFTSIGGGVYGGGASTGGGSPRGPDGRFLPQGGGGGPGGGSGVMDVVNKFPVQSYANYLSGTGYRSDAIGLATDIVKNLPVIGTIGGKLMDMVGGQYKKSDDFLGDSLDAYRTGGIEGREGLRGVVQSDIGREKLRNAGVTRQEAASLQKSMLGSYYGGTAQGVEAVSEMQGHLGMGSQGIGLMKSLVAGGGASGKGDEMQVFSQAIGTALVTGLDRTRWPEMVDSMSKAAEQLGSIGNVSAAGVMEMQSFMNQIGQRYLPGGAGESNMRGLLTGMMTGKGGGLGEFEALRTAGMGGGQDYFEAEFDVETGALAGPGGLQRLFSTIKDTDPIVRDFLAGKMSLKKAAVLFNRTHKNAYKVQEISDLLQALQAGKAPLQPDTGNGTKMIRLALPKREGAMAANAAEHSFEGTGVGPSGDIVDPDLQAPPTPSGTGNSSPVDSTGGGSGGNITGLGQLSATDIRGAAESAGIPVETMRSWFKIESAGRLASDSSDADKSGNITARGFNRMSLEEAQSLGYTKADWMRMSSDKKLSLDASAKLAAKYYARAKEQAPAGWKQEDMLHLMKYQHGGAGYAKSAFNDYKKQHGGNDPASWDEFYQAEEPRLSGSPGVGARGAIQNANKIDVHIHVDQTGRVAGTSVKSAGPVSVSTPLHQGKH